MSRLIEQIKQKDACAFTHGGKFHADDVFSSALLLYINPEISITRGNSVPDDFTGIVFDIGRGEFDHHQKDSRIRENGVPYAAFGLLWESVGADILGEVLAKHDPASRILVLPEFIPCQKALSETDIAFVIFPSNRGGFCIQPQKREYSMNYKCSFPAEWLGLEGEELVNATGISGAIFCHKGGFIMTVKEQDEAVKACEKALSLHKDSSVIVWYGSKGDTAAMACDSQTDELLINVAKARGIKGVHICHVGAMPVPQLELTELDSEKAYAEVLMEKPQWKAYVKEQVKQIVKYRPEAVYVEGNAFETYPVIRALRKKHIPVLTMIENKEKKIMVRIP